MRNQFFRAGMISLLLAISCVLAMPSGAVAQTPDAGSATAPVSDDDLEIDPSEPDFTVITLPTNLRLPRHKLGFFLTHRFARPLGRGDFGDLVSDLFGFDGGAQIGLGLRFGLLRGTQIGLYRTSDRTIQLYVQSEIVSPKHHAVGVSVNGSIEGTENFGLSDPRIEGLDAAFSPALSLVISRPFGTRGAAYLVPRWVGNTNLVDDQPGDDYTFLLGVGLRVRLYGSTYLTGEVLPRLSGYKGALCSATVCIGDTDTLFTFGIEKQVGGHAFQINFANGIGTTPRQTVTEQTRDNDWFIGFNLSRKFY
jgi:Membrane bound beta barrel domain (DUF5777)